MIHEHPVKNVILLYNTTLKNEEIIGDRLFTNMRHSALVKTCNAHRFCTALFVGFKTKESQTCTLSSQEKNWFLGEEIRVEMHYGGFKLQILCFPTKCTMDTFCNNS